jgi:hypothetical protein
MKRKIVMSITRFLAGFIAVGVLAFGVVGAHADSANGPDAGIGIPGYNVPYQYSASGLPPGESHARPNYRHSYRKYGAHNGYHRWY